MLRIFALLMLPAVLMACLIEPRQAEGCGAHLRPVWPGVTKHKPCNAIHGWHPRKVSHRELCLIESLQPGRLFIAAHPDFTSPIIVKAAFTDDERRDLDHEVSVYQVAHGTGVTPEFYGHVFGEDGRTFGFMMEYISSRPETQANYQTCEQTLRALHRQGITHGDAHAGNCIPRADGSAVLVDFELAQFLSHSPDLTQEQDRDLDIMRRCIQAMPDR